jgi:hypothetical protein
MITSNSPPPKVVLPTLLKMREVAKILSLSRGSVQALIESGDLDAQPLNPTGKRRMKRVHVRITRESLLNFYQKRFGQPLQRALQNPFTT